MKISTYNNNSLSMFIPCEILKPIFLSTINIKKDMFIYRKILYNLTEKDSWRRGAPKLKIISPLKSIVRISEFDFFALHTRIVGIPHEARIDFVLYTYTYKKDIKRIYCKKMYIVNFFFFILIPSRKSL